jgi:hypothetical protein
VFGCAVRLHTFEEFNRTDGPAHAIAHGYLVDGPVALFAADVTGDEPSFRCEGMMLSLLGTAAPSTVRWSPSTGRQEEYRRSPMAVFVVRLGPEQFVMWSNTVDAPVSPLMGRDDLVRELQSKYEFAEQDATQTLDSAEADGTSCRDTTLEEVLEVNRAGPGEERLTLAEIIEQYTER